MSKKQNRKQRKAGNLIRSIVKQEIKKERERPKVYTISLSRLTDFSWLYADASRLLPFPTGTQQSKE